MNWVRVLLLVEVFWIYLSWIWINERFKPIIPTDLYRVGLAGSLVPLSFFVAVLANALIGAPVTLGTYIVTTLLAPVIGVNALVAVRVSVRAEAK